MYHSMEKREVTEQLLENINKILKQDRFIIFSSV